MLFKLSQHFWQLINGVLLKVIDLDAKWASIDYISVWHLHKSMPTFSVSKAGSFAKNLLKCMKQAFKKRYWTEYSSELKSERSNFRQRWKLNFWVSCFQTEQKKQNIRNRNVLVQILDVKLA